MPSVTRLRVPIVPSGDRSSDGSVADDNAKDNDIQAWTISLYLPSDLSAEHRSSGLPPDLIEKEIRLRIAQAEDALLNLKSNLRRSACVWGHKNQHTAGTGTRPNTRMQALISRYERKIQRDADRYRAAREALLHLHLSAGYVELFPVLKKTDVCYRAMEEDPKKRKRHVSQGRVVLSWIWTRKATVVQTAEQEQGNELDEGAWKIVFQGVLDSDERI